ncbi:MBL fold metallo-hydrolase [Desulfosediminicola ganghwensis]|uniref:MBL fold metallo-hydrolase n=1 Tax=Desulfosediminicola ganghwensis TaxID=2569540 RepID=UPI0010ACF3A8|nr:MBL fold metallo-hydrolase [Desulfosediminicola ganghwensis]
MLTQHTINTPYIVGPVHCYTLERDGELLLFDTGPYTMDAMGFMRNNIDLSRLRHIFITHCHIDHYGLAHWLEKETDATIYLPYRDALKMEHHHDRMELMYDLLVSLGFGESYLRELRRIFESGVLFPPFPKEYQISEDFIPEELGIEVINCPGHSQSDVVYVVDDYVVTGDTLLRGIFQSPLLDIDLNTGKRFKNYDAYCKSIVKLAALNDYTVLPGHRESVSSIEDILLFYIDKLLIRVEQMVPFRDQDNVSWIIEKFFNKSMTDVFHIYLKASEIRFMQDLLAEPEQLKRSLETIGLFDKVADKYARVALK